MTLDESLAKRPGLTNLEPAKPEFRGERSRVEELRNGGRLVPKLLPMYKGEKVEKGDVQGKAGDIYTRLRQQRRAGGRALARMIARNKLVDKILMRSGIPKDIHLHGKCSRAQRAQIEAILEAPREKTLSINGKLGAQLGLVAEPGLRVEGKASIIQRYLKAWVGRPAQAEKVSRQPWHSVPSVPR